MAKILIVDDLEEARELFEAFLSVEHEVTTAEDWVSASPVFGESNLVILDVNMPVLKGNQLAEIMIRAKSDLKVVLASSMDERELRRLASEAGAAGYVTKTFDHTLLPRINAFLR